jgi:hypothetical protein
MLLSLFVSSPRSFWWTQSFHCEIRWSNGCIGSIWIPVSFSYLSLNIFLTFSTNIMLLPFYSLMLLIYRSWVHFAMGALIGLIARNATERDPWEQPHLLNAAKLICTHCSLKRFVQLYGGALSNYGWNMQATIPGWSCTAGQMAASAITSMQVLIRRMADFSQEYAPSCMMNCGHT